LLVHEVDLNNISLYILAFIPYTFCVFCRYCFKSFILQSIVTGKDACNAGGNPHESVAPVFDGLLLNVKHLMCNAVSICNH
jgi:hypothetical protein